MKASELIKELENLIETEGDLEVVVPNIYYRRYEGSIYGVATTEILQHKDEILILLS